MSEKDPFAFIHSTRDTDNKRPADERLIDFEEIYQPLASKQLTQQSARCLDCGNPYCEWKCPLHNYIPNWLDLVTQQRFEQAAALMHETNPLPEICGRVCPQDRLCEQACTINTGFGAVTIGEIEKNIADRAMAKKWRPDLSKVVATDKTVAIVGAGPAGLSCAEYLVRNGVQVRVFDKHPDIGGLLTFGIPNFKLDKKIMKARRDYFEDIGIKFELNTEIGKQITIEQLQLQFDAVFLAMGCYQSVSGNLKGLTTNGVINALDYLIGNISQQHCYQMKDYPFYEMKDKNVVVLGGGDTAMDCVRSAVRQKAKSVTCVYRRDEASMPGSKKEFTNAREEGVDFLFNRQPIAIQSESDQVTGVQLAETELVNEPSLASSDSADSRSRSSFVVKQERQSTIAADCVILAFGFIPSPADWFERSGILTDDKGLVKTIPFDKKENCTDQLNYSQQTHQKNIFAGGDMVRGADLVVTAIAEGRQAASEILNFIFPSPKK